MSGELLEVAVQLTVLSSFAVILNAFSQFLNSILQAKGFYNHSLAFFVIGGILKILTLVIFAINPSINIYAIPISNVVLYSTFAICSLIKLGFLIKIDVFSFALPLVSAFAMFLVVKLWLSLLSGVWGVLSGVIIGGGVYLALCFPLVLGYGKEFFQKIRPKV